MLYDGYRLYQLERAKSPTEIQYADEQAARLASAVSSPFRAITSAVRTARSQYLAAGRGGTAGLAGRAV